MISTLWRHGRRCAPFCGQCHVEYYLKGAEKRVVYPWAKGLQIEEMLAYYDEADFKDWTHADTGAPLL
jgi:nitrite reductase (cytochrome c-552)